MSLAANRPPIVTDLDRAWAMAQMPPWCQHGDLSDACGDDADDGGRFDDADDEVDAKLDKPSWSMFVAEEIEKFEQHYAGERRPASEWSSMWRKGWWPRVSPRKRFPKSAPQDPQPFFRAGTPEFERALGVATADERALWTRFGIAQFKPDDPRLAHVRGKAPEAGAGAGVEAPTPPVAAAAPPPPAAAPRNRPMFEIRFGDHNWQAWIDWLCQRARGDLVERAERAGALRALTRWPAPNSELPFIGPVPQAQRRAAGGR